MDISPFTSYLEIAFAVNVLFLWQGVWDRLGSFLLSPTAGDRRVVIRVGIRLGEGGTTGRRETYDFPYGKLAC